MKKTNVILGMALPIVLALQAHGQPGVLVGGAGGGRQGSTLVNTPPGTFNFNNQEITKAIVGVNEAAVRQKAEDAQFIVSQIQQLQAQMNKIDTEIFPKLMKLSQDSQGGNFANMQNFLDLNVVYEAALSVLKNNVGTLQSIIGGTLPSTEVSISESKTVVLDGRLKADLTKLRGLIDAKLSEFQAKIDSMPVTFVDKGEIQQTFPLGKVDFSKVTILTSAEIKAMQAKIDSLRTIQRGFEIGQDLVTKDIGKLAHDFIIETGTEERWRFKNASDVAANLERYQSLAEYFTYRSYMRTKTGLQMGAVGVVFKKRFANIEKFLLTPWDFVQFYNYQTDAKGEVVKKDNKPVILSQKNPIRNIRELESAKEAYRNLVETSEERSASIFDGKTNVLQKAWSLVTGEVNLLAKANSLITLATGYREMQRAANLVLRLLAADLHEEILLARSASGHAQVREFFKSRYQSTSDSKATTLNIICGIDAIALGSACKSANGGFKSATANVLQGGSGNVTASLKKLISDTDNVVADLGRAAVMQTQLDLNKRRNNGANDQMNKDVKDLFN